MVANKLSKLALLAAEEFWSHDLPSSCYHAHVSDMWGDRNFRSFVGVVFVAYTGELFYLFLVILSLDRF